MDQDQAAPNAVFYDGHSNRKRRVTLRFRTAIDIVEAGVTLASWPYADIRRADGHKLLRLSAVSAPPLARLDIEDPATAEAVLARCTAPERTASGRQTWRIVGWSLAAAASIIVMTLYGIPLLAERMVPLIPIAAEQRLGNAVDRQLRAMLPGDNCTEAEGQRAFAKMVERLQEAGGLKVPIDPQVIASSIPNAVALPGGRIYLFDGLLRRADSPDEVAGVIAHEIGHVQHRDGMRRLLQAGGTSFLIGLLFGDITGGGAVIFVSRALLNASHSREAETNADEFAIATMRRLGRSPAPMGELLVRMTNSERPGTILDSHPVSAEQLERMKKAAPDHAGPPLLTDQEWQALKRVCPAIEGPTSPGGAIKPGLQGPSGN